MNAIGDEALTLGQVCAFLRINRETLKRLEAAGQIKVFRPPVGRPKVMRSELDAFIRKPADKGRGPRRESPGRPDDQIEAARGWIREKLRGGPVGCAKLVADGQAAGYSTRTLYRALDSLDISAKGPRGARSYALDDGGHTTDPGPEQPATSEWHRIALDLRGQLQAESAMLGVVKAQRDKLAMLLARDNVIRYQLAPAFAARLIYELARNPDLKPTPVEAPTLGQLSADLDRLVGLPS